MLERLVNNKILLPAAHLKQRFYMITSNDRSFHQQQCKDISPTITRRREEAGRAYVRASGS
jgi:hypothetical protein